MGEDRLNGLASLNIHCDINLEVHQIFDEFFFSCLVVRKFITKVIYRMFFFKYVNYKIHKNNKIKKINKYRKHFNTNILYVNPTYLA